MGTESPPPLAPGMTVEESRVILLPPTSRDADAMRKMLAANAVPCVVCPTMHSLCEEVGRGAGVVLVSEEAITADPDGLIACVRGQDVWSDLPILVLSRSGAESPRLSAIVASLGNVSVLERPVRMSTLLSVVRSALRARVRQHEVRAHLAERERAEQHIRASEERLRLAVQTGKLGVWELDVRSGELTTSRGCKSNFGRGPDDRFTCDDFWAGVHADDLAGVREALASATDRGAEIDVEFRTVWPDRTTHWVLVRGRPDGEGAAAAAARVLGVTVDITERKTAEERRAVVLDAERSARVEAERAGRMKDEFLATLSHELRTPLNAVLGWATILKGEDGGPAPSAEDLSEGVEVIERNARVQAQIIEDLLDMSRIVSGKVRLDVRRADLAAVVRAAVETVRPAADAKGVRIDAAPVASSVGTVNADPNRLQQVFWNILSNAVKFTPAGGDVRVNVERGGDSADDRLVVIGVADTGEGIPPEFLPHVFDRFRQADGSTTRRHGGLGLGLAIVKQLVELHGGTIRAASAGAGRGSTFLVALPLAAAGPEPGPRLESRRPVAGSARGAIDGCAEIAGVRVLVVDDEPDARTLLRRVLEDCDAVVTTAGSAAEAYERLRSDPPDVLVSDIGMPGEDGYGLIRRVRSLAADQGGATPAVALTAYARAEDRVRAIVAGYQHHVTKPVEPAELIAMVASLTIGRPGRRGG